MRLIPALILLLPTLTACDRPAAKPATTAPAAAVVFRSPDGRTLTADDLKGFTGKANYEIIGTEDIPPAARDLHEQARAAGSRGEYDQALALLARAVQLAPKWPYPAYDTAFTYLLKHDPDNARLHYRKTLDLAPRGFFTAITALDILDRERRGEFPAGFYTAYVMLESAPPKQRESLIRQITARQPTFAPAWKDLAYISTDPAERLAALEKGLDATPDAETRGMLLINKALALHARNQADDRATATQILGQLATDPTSTLATEHLSKAALANLISRASK